MCASIGVHGRELVATDSPMLHKRRLAAFAQIQRALSDPELSSSRLEIVRWGEFLHIIAIENMLRDMSGNVSCVIEYESGGLIIYDHL